MTRFCSVSGGVAGLHGHGLLQQNGPAVAFLVYKVDGSAGQLHAAGQRGLVHAQSVSRRGRRSWGSGWDEH